MMTNRRVWIIDRKSLKYSSIIIITFDFIAKQFVNFVSHSHINLYQFVTRVCSYWELDIRIWILWLIIGFPRCVYSRSTWLRSDSNQSDHRWWWWWWRWDRREKFVELIFFRRKFSWEKWINSTAMLVIDMTPAHIKRNSSSEICFVRRRKNVSFFFFTAQREKNCLKLVNVRCEISDSCQMKDKKDFPHSSIYRTHDRTRRLSSSSSTVQWGRVYFFYLIFFQMIYSSTNECFRRSLAPVMIR